MAAGNSPSIGPIDAVSSINTTDLATEPVIVTPQANEPLYKTEIPEPVGIQPHEVEEARVGDDTDSTRGVGVEGEVVVWEARYSNRRFIGRAVSRAFLSLAWMVLAWYTWAGGQTQLTTVTWIALVVVAIFWVVLAVRMIQAHYAHFYQLTNRRLFVSTGIFSRRRDMLELLLVKDVFTQQPSLLDRWCKVGTVVTVPKEKELPTFYLTGVADPKEVMDLIWHHARAERDQRSLRVDEI
jgi:membrane protein YdbS with pleckstrin-like domain